MAAMIAGVWVAGVLALMGVLGEPGADAPATTETAPVDPSPDAETGSATGLATGSATGFADARALLDALAERDRAIDTLTGQVRLTAIQALQGDTQRRTGRLAIKTVRGGGEAGGVPDRRLYAVHFRSLQIDRRVEDIDERYIFDGRWLVEEHPGEKQFIKREIVPTGRTLDPMDLMRDAPFWVSVGDDADRVLRDYDAALHGAADGLADNPELAGLAALAEGCVQLELTPREGSPGEDDWRSVRIWFEPTTLLPRLYVKEEWTGDLQIAELFGVGQNAELPEAIFDTTTPEPGSGWQVQVSPWRGRSDG